MKCLHICAPKQPLRNNFWLHCGFESHYGNTKEDLRHSLQNIVLNVFKYFKEEAMKFPPNHPQRSYVKKTAEATGLPQRTISWQCQSPKSSSSSSGAAQTSQSVTTPAELPASSTSDHSAGQDITTCDSESAPRAIIVDGFDKADRQVR